MKGLIKLTLLITIVLVSLKLTMALSWSWMWILSPIWIVAAGAMCIFMIIFLCCIVWAVFTPPQQIESTTWYTAWKARNLMKEKKIKNFKK